MTTLQITTELSIPLEAEAINPDRFGGQTLGEIALLPVTLGNQQACLGDFFAIRDDGSPDITVEGDLRRVKLIGAGMSRGQITLRGDVGMHLGAGLRGGRIIVHGNAADWAGAEMRGGQIFIHGNAGHGLGSAYRGSPKGMNRGLIVVTGNTAEETGTAMRRGLIVVGGTTGDYPGAFMIAGTLIVLGRLGGRPGAASKRGTIIAGQADELLPSYRYACTYTPVFLDLILRHLAEQGVAVPAAWRGARFRRYCGDLTALGKGEILIWEGA
jgi:formylmethanofuran dehydrogenase subunit C